MNPTEPCLQRFLDLGIAPKPASKILKLLRSGDGGPEELEARANLLIRLAHATGNLQNAKLAYSLASRSDVAFTVQTCDLLEQSVRCSDCVPAAVRLWKAAVETEVTDPSGLVTASRLGDDGATQIRILNLLRDHADRLPLIAELARRLHSPGWECDGSWGTHYDVEHGQTWWDYANPREHKAYGMTLTSQALDLSDRLGARLLFETKHQILGTTDRCHLEVSRDGRRWERRLKFEGELPWSTMSLDLSEFQGSPIFVRFHVLSGGNRSGSGIRIANPRLESVPVRQRRQFQFSSLSDGWQTVDEVQTGFQVLTGGQSESALESDAFQIPDMLCPTLTFSAKVVASSVYAAGSVEVLSQSGETVAQIELDGGETWSGYTLGLPVSDGGPLKLRLFSRFSRRRDGDGFWLKDLALQAGDPNGTETMLLDGGFDDGRKEKEALLTLLETQDSQELENLAVLRRELPSLASALALNAFLESKVQIPALVQLYSSLKEEAFPAFSLLRSLASDQEMLLQSKVLLTSGLEHYLSTRDYLGDGLVSKTEFEDNCSLYLSLRQKWTEEEARQGLSLLLTPVAAEDFGQRETIFRGILESHPQAEEFFSAWEEHWSNF